MLRDVVGKKAIFCVGIKAIDFRKIITLNESGEWIWNEARACEEFDTTPEEAEAYVTEFLEQLDKEGVIESSYT